MKLRLVRICVLLVLGALVNVAVALGCAYFGAPEVNPDLRFETQEFERLELSSFVPDFVYRIHDGLLSAEVSIGRGVRQTRFTPRYRNLSGQPHYLATQTESGWPLLSLEGMSGVTPASKATARSQLRGVWCIQVGSFQGRNGVAELPLRPIWPGFAINTVFYAGVLWLLFAAPFALRKRRRIKRGLCPKCAYDLRGSGKESTACPECGAALTRQVSHL